MPWEFPEDIDPSQLDGMGDVVAEGDYHFQVSDIKYDANDRGDMMMKAEAIGGENVSELGKTHVEYYPKPFPGCKKGIWSKSLGLAIALGLTTKEELEALRAKGKAPVIHFEHGVGRQFVGRIVKEEYTKDGEVRHSHRLNYNVWSLDHPNAKRVKLNQTLMQGGGQSPDPFSGGAGGNGSGGQQKPADDDPFGGSDPF